MIFYDKQCTIQSRTYSIIHWRETETKTILYTTIPCDFYHSHQSQYNPSNEAREYEQGKYEVVVPWDYSDIKKWMIIELFDLWSWGIFLIDTVQIHRLPSGTIDNLTLSVHLIENV